ncbi:DEAD/DEAH box helicase [Lactiplantibacillus herbarum]|uniref:DEAD/DEAH box helicase n=1 Tax=Lactiplantibacillus herbarum TaxID=1670446 RepID=UPI00064F0966|nr:DNA/RNA helicase [Lactiplantibacillus herbarum]
MDPRELYGRQVPLTASEAAMLPDNCKLPAMLVTKQLVQCLRCGSQLDRKKAQLPQQQFYCYQCLNLGRISTLTHLYHMPEPNDFPTRPACTWQGQLTEQQKACALTIRENFEARKRHLLWAVTGAGKTEMLFPGITWALAQGWRIALASPRVDVCLELAPRLQAAFADAKIAVLHGRNPEPYQYRQHTICTTHQLLRFREAFDVLIIDEVDAFPFAANPRLAYAVKHAVKADGALLYLTATPSQALQKQVHRGELGISYLPLRFHQHLLPTIKVKLQPNWQQLLRRGQLPRCLVWKLQFYLDKHQRFLLFVPRVKQLAPVQAAIQHYFPELAGLTVHSTDAERLEKVQQMRDQKIQYLVTTTILERGVTFPGIDVIVLGADDEIFSTAALVQIAGRVGRSKERSTGLVWFICASHDRNIKRAQRQIALVNRKGRRLLRATLSPLSTAHS